MGCVCSGNILQEKQCGYRYCIRAKEGALRSLVTVFLSFFPLLISVNNAFLALLAGGGAAGAGGGGGPGGGGGGGPGAFFMLGRWMYSGPVRLLYVAGSGRNR